MPVLEGLRVIRSKIHGYGAVTTRVFQPGEVICYGDGVLYSLDAEFNDTYALVVPAEDTGDGKPAFFDLVCQTRWFNHSCEPNTDIMLKWDEATKTVVAWWVALREIQ